MNGGKIRKIYQGESSQQLCPINFVVENKDN